MTKSIDWMPASPSGTSVSSGFRPSRRIRSSSPLIWMLFLAWLRLLASMSRLRQQRVLGHWARELTCCDETPRPLRSAQEGVDAARPGAHIKPTQLTARRLVRCRVHQVLEPQDIIVTIWNLVSVSVGVGRTERGGQGTDRRTEPVFGQFQLQAKVKLKQSLCQLHCSCRVAKI